MTVVQRSPDLGLTLRMQRVAVQAPASAPGGAGGGDGVGVAWLVEPSEFSANWIQHPVLDGWRVVSMDRAIDGEVATQFRAVAVGAGTGVEWAWSVDTAPLGPSADWVWSGVTVAFQDGTARVEIGTGTTLAEDFRYAVVTLVASRDGVELGTLSLRVTFNWWLEPTE